VLRGPEGEPLARALAADVLARLERHERGAALATLKTA
jgi:hypothetical protein